MGAGHHHGHAHGHAHHHHGHAHGGASPAENRNRLTVVLVLVVAYMLAEVVGGVLTNSLALLADAGHMLSDAAALGLSVFAIWISQRPPTSKRTYGYYRTEILTALANGAALVAISLLVFIEAFRRLGSRPPEVEGNLMLAVAGGGLIVNVAGLWILNAGKSQSLNVRGARLHILSDALGSVGVIVAGVSIWMFGWNWADPIASIVIGLLVLYSSWALLKEAVAVLMEEAPGHLNVDEIRDAIISVRSVIAVEDLHVWTITSGLVSLSAHVAVDEERPSGEMLTEIRHTLHGRFGIDHLTIQLEPEGFEKRQTPV